MRLKRDIHSYVNPKHKYGHAGDEVKLIEQRGTVWIVENEEGKRFSTVPENLTEDEIKIEEELKVIINPVRVAQRPPAAKPVPIQQTSLF